MFITFSSLYSFKGTHGGFLDLSYIQFFDFAYSDKVVHFMFYSIAGILGCLYLFKAFPQKSMLKSRQIVLVVSLVFFGIIIEVVQEVFTTSRSGDFLDALANSIGVFCGVFIINALFHGQRRLK